MELFTKTLTGSLGKGKYILPLLSNYYRMTEDAGMSMLYRLTNNGCDNNCPPSLALPSLSMENIARRSFSSALPRLMVKVKFGLSQVIFLSDSVSVAWETYGVRFCDSDE
ncbi:MAG: hypothetical protein GVX96_05625 [Bacteroidetes bacterium]|nr:hypothetical protein [Bacteroidota bacterium]